jgi:glycerol-3-phosphate O-acyltransferase
MFFCVASAHRFLHTLTSTPLERLDTTGILIGGKDHTTMTSDIWWALTQPRGNILMRFLGFFFLKIFRSSCDSITLDVASFSNVVRFLCDHEDKEIHVILAPTHRSFYDFILLSFIAFSLPELRIQIPFIAAAEEFSSLPYIGWMLHYLNAFYVRRGTGKDPNLEQEVRRIKNKAKGQRSFIEVFIEGSRSRDRRYQMPKTGFLRCLMQTGGKHLIIPININYERIPEQDALVNESKKGLRRNLTTKGLASWIWVSTLFSIN